MTNHWNDIDNSSCVIVMGANPAENHPACFAHINSARFGNKNAKLIVVDPRQTRTARQVDPNRGEFYVRIRPGTDIAFLNGMMKWIMDNAASQQYNATAMNRMIDWHNGWMGVGDKAPASTATRGFIADAYANVNLDAAAFQAGTFNGVATSGVFDNGRAWPKYCDTRLKVNAAGNDYKRGTFVSGANTFSNMPEVAHDIDDPDCVYQKLKAHVAPYDLATVADICGCTQQEIVNVAKAFVDNSRFASSDFGAAIATPQNAGYKATTFLYAMGQTQHTYGSQNIKGIAEIQTLMGNMGRPGGGINALRGIHNVQGSTDFALLFDGIPGYSGNPTTGTMSNDDEYIHYQDTLFGTRILDPHKTGVSGGINCLDQATFSGMGLQQRGFHNMTQEFFGNGAVTADKMGSLYSLWPKGNGYQHIEAFRRMVSGQITAAVVWGQNPAVTEPNQSAVRTGLENLDLLVVTDMFETETAACKRKAGAPTYLIPACSHVEEAGSVTNSGRWLQWREQARKPVGNSKTDLELMLRFAYALDQANAFSHIKQVWSDISILPAGVTVGAPGGAYDTLYRRNYGWSPADALAFDDVPGTIKRWKPGAAAPEAVATTGSEVIAENVFKEICGPLNPAGTTGGTMWIYSGNGGESAWNTNLADNATVGAGEANGAWLLENRAKSRNSTRTGASVITDANALNYPRWGWAWLLNRRVFYNNSEVAADRADTFVSPGYLSCLFTLETTNDMADWAGPFAYRKYKKFNDRPSTVAWNGLAPAAGTEGSAHWLRDVNGDIVVDETGKAVSLAGRFSAHCEPIESPKPSPSNWGVNTSKGNPLIFLAGNSQGYAATSVGAVADFPLVMTTIRCVEHFQGGPITRNNAYNVEAEPEPWIEINPIDARKYGIANGDYVNVITARSNSAGPTALNPGRVNDQNNRSADGAMAPAAGWNKGFVARVDNSIAAYQRVAPGVVAIPWHWGDRGLGTGSRANDLCIDAWDANTMIPEYKACLCKIEKA